MRISEFREKDVGSKKWEYLSSEKKLGALIKMRIYDKRKVMDSRRRYISCGF